jgi:hypothetical protein
MRKHIFASEIADPNASRLCFLFGHVSDRSTKLLRASSCASSVSTATTRLISFGQMFPSVSRCWHQSRRLLQCIRRIAITAFFLKGHANMLPYRAVAGI